MQTGWYARVVRLPVYPGAIDGQPGWNANPDAYFTEHLDPAVQSCISKQIYCIIDWHYIKDYTSSDVDTATRAFWNYVAPKYASSPNVIFELFNEPIYPDDWSTRKKTVQPWVDIIRAAAPNNLILIGGPRWSQNVAEAATNPFAGSNLVLWLIFIHSKVDGTFGIHGLGIVPVQCLTSSRNGAGSRAEVFPPVAQHPGMGFLSALILIRKA